MGCPGAADHEAEARWSGTYATSYVFTGSTQPA
jgi:hypothetical protein